MKKYLLLASAMAALAVPAIGFSQQSAAPVAAGAAADGGATRYGAWGFDLTGMDKNVKPGDDWYRFVNGAWNDRTQIPADRSSFGAFAVLRDLSEVRLRSLISGYSATDSAHPDRMKAAILYSGFMDEALAEKLDAQPLTERLGAIRAVASKGEMSGLMGRTLGGFGASFFGAGVSDDAKNPDVYALYLRQSGLGLGDRDLYLDAKFAPQVARYKQYVAQMLGMAGWADAEAAADKVVALETSIAKAHWTRVQSRDRDKTYNPVTPAELKVQAPGFDWDAFWVGAGLSSADRVIVAQNTAIPAIAKVFADTDLETLKAWQAFRTTDDISPLLSKRFVDAQFEFRSKFMNGQPQQRERWKRAVAFTERGIGEGVGRDYVALYFPPASKAKMDTLVANLRVALAGRINNLAWMSPATKEQAQAKLKGFTVKIGYPDKWRDYSAFEVKAGDLVGNAERSGRFEWDYRRKRLGGPVDKAEWGMTPQTVNAYYNSVKNEIVFPAAILQAPFFDPQADDAINYGGIGGVIGHEISHGFDDQGRKSDGNGVLRDWWAPEDAAKFEAQAVRFGAQYEAYSFEGLPGVHINGRASMGENIGDLGGVLIALDAYHQSLGGKKAKVIDGFTGDQRFFLGWGQVWRTLFRTEALRQQLVGDPHSPGQVRAVNPLRNVDAWYEAWKITPDQKQYVAPADRVRIW
ncbi:M13-type metalloendopeptidase [Sphingomonas sp. NIBR02145]|uniref:M13 family metallopeptidase n=1 Tax=Sphingomonas sp. NIBR02145 TaxID=3014784 RepID=UPI0022B44BF7|nr:M13-type metalloendopeptidase [Sphingomonas sp. NIBR02145]WHU03275.1 M13-type metalloendopeptidase [Sphingomonas sp. NIBR02145]